MYTSSLIFFQNPNSQAQKFEPWKSSKIQLVFEAIFGIIFRASVAAVTKCWPRPKDSRGFYALRNFVWDPKDILSGKRKNVYLYFEKFRNRNLESEKKQSSKMLKNKPDFKLILFYDF